MEKKKILFLSDHPLVPSGVGSQAKYLIEGLLKTGKFKFLCLGGAIKHYDYRIQKVEPEKYGDDWFIVPVNGHGDKDVVRKMLYNEKPDAMVLFTDPRFFYWAWEMEDEIRSVCPLLYWHVWDNDPSPDFNKIFYDSTDHVSCISLKTYGILDDINYKNKSYIPHALPSELFKPLEEKDVAKFKKEHFGYHADSKFVVFWNNRNARRKQTGDVVATFAKFAQKVGQDNVSLLMHTQAKDPEGQDVIALADKFNIKKRVILSEDRIPPELLNFFYNCSDVTMNISSNEGFGLSTLESLYSGTPIIAHFTGGLQYQLGDWWNKLKDFSNQDKLTNTAKKNYKSNIGNWWGVPVFSASRSCTGSQQIPYIYDDKVNHDDVVKGLVKLYNMGKDKRKELGLNARKWAMKYFSMEKMISSWDDVLTSEIKKFNSNDRLHYRNITI